MLPFAAATHTEMLAKRLTAHITRLNHALYVTLGIALFLLVELYIYDIARCTIGYKHHHIIYTRKAFPLSGHSGYLHALYHGQCFPFPAQC